MAASINLEHILSKLLVPDNNIINQATQELRESFKNPQIYEALGHTIFSAENPQVRQYAAILLRRKLLKKKQWITLSENLRKDIKQMILLRLTAEQEKPVRSSVALLAGTVARHEFTNDTWPEILHFVQEFINSHDPRARELAMITLEAVASIASLQLKPHLDSLFNLFSQALQETENSMVIVYTVRTLAHLIYLIGSDEMAAVQKLIPRITMLMKQFVVEDEEKAVELISMFDELVESEVTIIVPHIKSVVEVCLEIIINPNLQDNTQIRAMSFISWLTRIKKKAVLKHKLVVPILNALFPVMCRPIEDDDDEDTMMNAVTGQGNNLCTCAAQVMDVMALHLPPDKLMVPLLKLIDPALQSNDPYSKKAAYLAIAVVSEGCAEYIRSKYLHVFLQSVCKGITDQDPIVRNAALFTLGQFSEYLQPDISKYASELLPVLFEYLVQICQHFQSGDQKPPSGISRMFYAIEMFCENLENEIVPYLPTLMERLLIVLTTARSISVRELAISAIGATASAAKEEMLPFLPEIINYLREYLVETQPEEFIPLQVQAIDVLVVLAKTIGNTNFMPLAEECMQLGLDILKRTNHPDLKRSIYGLFGALSYILKEDMVKHLPIIIPQIITSLKSSEGVVKHYKDDQLNFDILGGEVEDEDDDDDEEDKDAEESDDEDITGYTVENSYLKEKEDACGALREIAESTQQGFMPYIEQCYEEVYKFLDYPNGNIRKIAIETLGQFCCSLHIVATNNKSEEGKEKLQTFLDRLIPHIVEIVEDDLDREAVMGALESLTELIKILKGNLFKKSDYLESVLSAANAVMIGTTSCQDKENEDDDPDEYEAEYDSMLIEYAGDVIAALALAVPPERYNPYFEQFLKLIIPKLKKNRSVPERSFGIGILALSCENMKEGCKPIVTKLLPLFLNAVHDEHEGVRANAIFGVGVLAENGKELLFDQYPAILQTLSTALVRETCFRPTDNICGAVARLIMTNVQKIPMEQVFPIMIKCLPLKEDTEENLTIFKCFLYLLNTHHPQMPKYFREIFKMFSHVLAKKQVSDEAKDIMMQVLIIMREEYLQEFLDASSILPVDIIEMLNTVA